MASIMDMINQSAQAAQTAPDITGAVHSGVQLAQAVQNIQSQRAEIENKKQQLDLSKWERLAQMGQIFKDMPEGPNKQSFSRDVFPAAMDALIGDKIHPMNKSMVSKDPSYMTYLMKQHSDGLRSLDEIKQRAGDPELMAEDMASPDFIKYKAGEQLKATPEALAIQDRFSAEAKSRLVTALEAGKSGKGITFDQLARAKNDPRERKILQSQLGLDRLGGEETLNDVLNTYPQALEAASKVGIQHDATSRDAALRTSGLDKRTSSQITLQTQNQVNNNPFLNGFDQRAVGARRLIGLIDNALNEKDPKKKVARTQQLVNAVSAEESQLVTGKANFAEGSREEAAYKNAESDLAALKDKFSSLITPEGTVTDVKELSAQLKNARNQANELGQSYVNEINNHLDTITTEEGALPEQLAIYKGKKDAFRKKFEGNFHGEKQYPLGKNGRTVTGSELKGFLQERPEFKKYYDPKTLKEIGL